jgi:hypothetical protein
MDLGRSANDVMPNNDADNSARPIFRVYRPVVTPTRTFPTLSSILDGSNSNIGEALPAISRTMSFRLTARDGLGGVNDASTTVTVDGSSGPFAVTAPNTAVAWTGGTSQDVTWNVANTTAAPRQLRQRQHSVLLRRWAELPHHAGSQYPQRRQRDDHRAGRQHDYGPRQGGVRRQYLL